jgi:hypothetical protein
VSGTHRFDRIDARRSPRGNRRGENGGREQHSDRPGNCPIWQLYGFIQWPIASVSSQKRSANAFVTTAGPLPASTISQLGSCPRTLTPSASR